MMVGPAMAVVAVTFVMMELTLMMPSVGMRRPMVPVSVDMRTMIGSLNKLGRPLDFPNIGMQDHRHVNPLQMGHG